MTLTRLPGSKWWIETDETSFEIVGTYNKAQITADIQAINATLASLPNPSQEATDVFCGLESDKQNRLDSGAQSTNQRFGKHDVSILSGRATIVGNITVDNKERCANRIARQVGVVWQRLQA